MIRVILPYHLRNLARVSSPVELEVAPPVTLRRVFDALEERFPMLRGTIRDHGTLARRPFLRFYVCETDWSHESPDARLPDAIASGAEPLMVIGAIAGGVEPVQAALREATWPTSAAVMPRPLRQVIDSA